MRITASAQGEGVDPFVGRPVLYHWPWYWHLPSLGPWLLLVMAVALPRTNRHCHALLIFVPLLILGLLWQTVTKATGMPSVTQMQFSFLIEFLAVGIALLWLNADRVGRCRGLVRWAASFGILFLGGLVVALSYERTFPAIQSAMILMFSALMGMVLLVSLALTRRLAHRRYRAVRFMVWLAVWCTLYSLAGVVTFVGVMKLVSSYDIHNLQAVITQILVPGLVLGLCVYAVNLP